MSQRSPLAQLGCCYYPEQWSDSLWKDDARRMVDLGMSIVRIGEFSWSRLEPAPGELNWDWLDRAINTLGDAGLKVVLGTPTATPPRWMLHKHPNMLALDINGQPRKFGSRRHYCFSYTPYHDESKRIASLMAERYAQHPALIGWQLDNEYGCHDTIRSYSTSALKAFRVFLAQRYSTISALNEAWGNIFWSMEYQDFDDIELPNQTVTEANPSHWLDFYRFSSEQVVRFNRIQAEAIKGLSDKPLIHNYMGRITEFDHYPLGEDLDIASWDTYPLGFLVDRSGTDSAWQKRFERQGDPDLQAFHHDLYRTVGRGRWWVMEQQPGPVNWAPNNPAPLPGMVAFWTWEAIAHQAEAVCYFRWRQAPFAQEQMHAGIMRPDNQPATAYTEVLETSKRIASVGALEFAQAEIALVFDYESCWAWEAQPQGENMSGFGLALDFYRALRRLGLNVDIVAPSANLSGYKVVFAPGLFTWSSSLLKAIGQSQAVFVLGPRTGSKTKDFQIPQALPPNIAGFDCKVTHVESFARGNERAWASDLNNDTATSGSKEKLSGQAQEKLSGQAQYWLEHCEVGPDIEVCATLEDGTPTHFRQNNIHYLAAWPDAVALLNLVKGVVSEAGIDVVELPEGVRRRVSTTKEFLFNYNAFAVELDDQLLNSASVTIRDRV